MASKTRRAGDPLIRPGWWTFVFVVALVGVIALTVVNFTGAATSFVPVVLKSERAGLVMEPGGKVKLHGVQVGKVSEVDGGTDVVSLKLDIFPDQVQYLPANVQARIRATTVFGAKYVDLLYPEHPTRERLAAGAVLVSENVSTEINTVFQDLTNVLDKIEPAKLNAVLTAFAEGLRGQGPTIGEATTAANQWLLAVNPRTETIRSDWQALRRFGDTYGAATPDLLRVLDAAATTSRTVTDNAKALDSLLLSVTGFGNSGIELLAPIKDTLVEAINGLAPTTDLFSKYNPELTCTLVGAKITLDDGYAQSVGGNGRTFVGDAALLFGDDPYRYPDNLPVVGAKGGFGGKPSCGALPDVAKNWPTPYLVTDTGYGTGMDIRPNPGIGFPGWANYFPVTRAVPEPPSIRSPGGPAPGPIPYPGAPPYGAPLYGADGTPLYPGLPPAPPPGAPREPGPPLPGSEPFVVPNPAQSQPTPGALPPDVVVPAP
jgi:phospholipid/cholesterol/gamma-HCH transport system substrate-binding protein